MPVPTFNQRVIQLNGIARICTRITKSLRRLVGMGSIEWTRWLRRKKNMRVLHTRTKKISSNYSQTLAISGARPYRSDSALGYCITSCDGFPCLSYALSYRLSFPASRFALVVLFYQPVSLCAGDKMSRHGGFLVGLLSLLVWLSFRSVFLGFVNHFRLASGSVRYSHLLRIVT